MSDETQVMHEFFQLQHKIAFELMLNLHNDNDRKIISKWLHVLLEPERANITEIIARKVMQILILMLNTKTLMPPFDKAPNSDENILVLMENHYLQLLNNLLIFPRQKINQKVRYEVTAEKKEIIGYQKLADYGSQFCYVYSNDPIVEQVNTVAPICDQLLLQNRNFIDSAFSKSTLDMYKKLTSQRSTNEFKRRDLPSIIETEDDDILLNNIKNIIASVRRKKLILQKKTISSIFEENSFHNSTLISSTANSNKLTDTYLSNIFQRFELIRSKPANVQ